MRGGWRSRRDLGHYGVAAIETGGEQQSAGLLHLIIQIPLTTYKINPHPTGWRSKSWKSRRNLEH